MMRSKRRHDSYPPSGFTIVELLIVIVVIGILAAITIVAYNGIQQKAQVATLQSDLEGAAKQLAMDQLTNNMYPITTAAANNGAGLKYSSGNNYSYTVDNVISPAYFCLRETNTTSTLSYFVTSTNSAPQVGGCSVTNLAMNPRATSTNASEWQDRYSTYTTNITGASDGPTQYLNSYSRHTFSTTSTGGGRGIDHRGNTDLGNGNITDTAWPVTAGTAMTVSTYIRSTLSDTNAFIRCRTHDSSGTWLENFNSPYTNYAARQWLHLSITFTPTISGYVACSSRIGDSATWTANTDYIDGTGLMVTSGPTAYSYADGGSPNWTWNGIVNNSTSTGSPL